MQFVFVTEWQSNAAQPSSSPPTSYASIPASESSYSAQALRPGSCFEHYMPPTLPGEQCSFVLDAPPSSDTASDVSGSPELNECLKRIPRPRNAFMLFRSHFLTEKKAAQRIHHDQRHISRVIGQSWRALSSEEKNLWHSRAERERLEHKRKYPDYKYRPAASRARPSVKRKVKCTRSDSPSPLLCIAGPLHEEGLKGKLKKSMANKKYSASPKNSPPAVFPSPPAMPTVSLPSPVYLLPPFTPYSLSVSELTPTTPFPPQTLSTAASPCLSESLQYPSEHDYALSDAIPQFSPEVHLNVFIDHRGFESDHCSAFQHENFAPLSNLPTPDIAPSPANEPSPIMISSLDLMDFKPVEYTTTYDYYPSTLFHSWNYADPLSANFIPSYAPLPLYGTHIEGGS